MTVHTTTPVEDFVALGNPMARARSARCLVLVLLAALAALLVPQRAGALIVTASYTGTIASGSDNGGYFGGGDLTGATITVAMQYDTSALSYTASSGDDFLNNSSVLGAVSDSVTINGITRTTANSSSSVEIVAQSPGPGSPAEEVTYVPNFSGNQIDLTLYTQGPTGSGWIAGAILGADPFGLLATYSLTQGGYQSSAFITLGGGAAESLTFYETAAQEAASIPEPASTAAMAAGLGGIAWVRRRKA